MLVVRSLTSNELLPGEVKAAQQLFDSAWSGADAFTDQDWEHAVGGLHFVIGEGSAILAHASVVERELHANGHTLKTGYVEAVATLPAHQRRGLGSELMRQVGEYIDRSFQLGALGTGRHSFYERLGWVTWKGPTFVRTDSGLVRTVDEDGYVMVRLTPITPKLDLAGPISCDWRPGDLW